MIDSHYSDLCDADDLARSLDSLDIPEPEYEVQTFEGEDDGGCADGACKI